MAYPFNDINIIFNTYIVTLILFVTVIKFHIFNVNAHGMVLSVSALKRELELICVTAAASGTKYFKRGDHQRLVVTFCRYWLLGTRLVCDC